MMRDSKKISPFFRSSGVIALVALFCFLIQGTREMVQAQGGGVSISPKRIIFKGRTRNAEVSLINSSDKPATYRIFFKNMAMTPEGTFEVLEDPEAEGPFADRMIRYSPREITVPANRTQSVRLAVRKPRDLPDGEYRSHLVFQTVPAPDAGTDLETLDLNQGELQVKFIPILSISIPIFVLHGDLEAEVKLSDLSLKNPGSEDNLRHLTMKLNRTGNRSVYGDFEVTYHPDQGEPLNIGIARGVAVYTPLDYRKVDIPLQLPDGVELNGGRLHVTYLERPEAGGEVLAEADLNLP
ncbi:MAG: molecular chaperone [Nitrospinaceae bacterium]|nr:molecular chaperone [Nitrospinaceae bacterium]NIS85343.1 molecular chaperone [Nitrospinaceae bacterium]NIT82153.1 molecular chaperone [Nitrospinaceae bacterium]NIU96547.1 molecular chaperone [Nitrospinaceae bacterium]NIY15366.1 molecular chaperone [Nitrospinaceae bacterium]